MNQKKRAGISDNVTINLTDFIWRVMIRWRVVCVIGIIVGLIAMALMYRKEMASYELALTAPSSEKELRESLTYQERRIVDFVIRNEKLVNSYSAYMNDSPLADINPFAEKVERVSFIIDGVEDGDISTIRAAYDSFLSSSKYLSGLAELMPEQYDESYVDELTFSGVSYGADDYGEEKSNSPSQIADNRLITVSVILLDGMDGEEVAKYVTTAMIDYTGELTGANLPHSLIVLSNDETSIVDSDLPITQRKYVDAAIASDSYLASAKQYFSEGQKKLYDLYMEDINSEAYYAQPDLEGEAAEKAKNEVELVEPHISVKYLILGFVAGALMYVFLYLVVILFRPRVKTADECEDALGIRTLGEIHEYHETGVNRLARSRFVYNLQHRRTRDTKLQSDKIRDSLAALDHKKKGANIEIVALDKLSDRAHEIVNELMDECKANGISISLLEGDVNTDTTFHRTLAEASDMVLFLSADRTKYPDIDLVLNLAAESDVDVAGTVFCEV